MTPFTCNSIAFKDIRFLGVATCQERHPGDSASIRLQDVKDDLHVVHNPAFDAGTDKSPANIPAHLDELDEAAAGSFFAKTFSLENKES